MTIAVVVLSVLLTISIAWNVVITKRALLLDSVLLQGGEALEESLDELNRAYANVGKIVQSPLSSNDPKVIQIHKELKRAHDSMLVVANRLVSNWNKLEEKEISNQ